jgi:hypothetical protein
VDGVQSHRAIAGILKHQLRHHDPCCVNIGTGIDMVATQLLGRHVGGRPGDRSAPLSGDGLGDAEVHDDHAPRLCDHDVLGLQIAVDEARVVDRLQTGQ